MVLRQHGSEWTPELKRLAYSTIDLSLLQRQSTSQEKHGRLRHFPASVNLGPGDRRLCMRLVLVSFTTAALLFRYPQLTGLSLLHLKRASETQNHLTFSYWVPEHQGTGYFMRSECIKLALVSFTLLTHCQLHVALVVNLT